jgi:hypothetical protein
MKLRVCYSLEMTTEQFERLFRLAELAPIRRAFKSSGIGDEPNLK